MSDCCASTSSKVTPIDEPKKLACFACGYRCGQVALETIYHHLLEPWLWQSEHNDCTSLSNGVSAYYFCSEPQCETVYFSASQVVIPQSELRTQVGVKQRGGAALLCYCYGVTRQQALNNPDAKAFVLAQTKLKNCACDTRNPSGRCCLKDFSKDVPELSL